MKMHSATQQKPTHSSEATRTAHEIVFWSLLAAGISTAVVLLL